MKILFTIIFYGIIATGFSQQKPSWDQWKWLMGDWAGEGNGKPGAGGGTFSFKLDLDQNVLIRKSHSEYPAADNKSKVIHDDLMVIYPTSSGIPSKAIYFDNEGHTINYSISYSEKMIILTSDKIPNIPVFRLTYSLIDNETVNTKFEMSEDGENFFTYVEGKSKKH